MLLGTPALSTWDSPMLPQFLPHKTSCILELFVSQSYFCLCYLCVVSVSQVSVVEQCAPQVPCAQSAWPGCLPSTPRTPLRCHPSTWPGTWTSYQPSSAWGTNSPPAMLIILILLFHQSAILCDSPC